MKRSFSLLALVLAAVVAAFPNPIAPPAIEAAQPKKGTNYAFLVACAGYDKAELQPIKDDVTINDVLEFKKALLETGFADENVVVMHDKHTNRRYQSEHDKIVKELDLFLDGMKPEDTVLVVLSGHGVHFKGDKTGHFCPVDAKLSTKAKLIPMDGKDGLYARLEGCKAGRKLLIANACRNDPAAPGANLAGNKVELTDEYPEAVPKGIAAIYSCEAGQKSYFDADRKRSLFFIHLTDAWRGKHHSGDGAVTLESVFEQTRVKTKADANKTFGEKQFPVVRRGYAGEWAVSVQAEGLAKGEKEEDFEYMIEGQKKRGKCRVLTVDVGGGVEMKLVRVKAGTFLMGSPKDEKERDDAEGLQREVEITKDFYLGQFEVTQAQYKAVTGDSPSKFKGDRLPVEIVSWNDAVKFCTALEKKLKRKVELPTEAQWEFACRAGTTTPFHFGPVLNGELANCHGNYPYGTDTKGAYKKTTTDVGSYPSNGWGLYDMSGNVWEWCQDYYGLYDKVEGRKDPVQLIKQSTYSRILRGGSWYDVAMNCRAASRSCYAPGVRLYDVGFRACVPLD